MIRICTHCKRMIGEKCVRCGAEAVPTKVNSQDHALVGTEFDCPGCGHHFPQGEGGETGALCEACLDAELRKAHERAIKGQER
jgi:DNA-directed RNA polymerase subunit RPC12/RpoP